MTLSSGVRLGPYEIVARVGAGGMGDGYRARDTRLDRTVAMLLAGTATINPSQPYAPREAMPIVRRSYSPCSTIPFEP